MIIMDEGNATEDLNGLTGFGIKDVYVGSESYIAKKKNCKDIKQKFKSLEFNKQEQKTLPFTDQFRNARANLTKNWDTIISIYYKLKLTMNYISKAQAK